MILSRPSDIDADPLSSAVVALGPPQVRITRFEAAGRWSLAFPARARLKFVAVRCGRCWLSMAGAPALEIAAGDVAVISASRFGVASDPALPAADGRLHYPPSADVARLGGDETVMVGSGLTFEHGPMRRLLAALPPLTLIRAGSPGAAGVGDVLRRLEDEGLQPRPGGPLLVARAVDVLMVELLRGRAEGELRGGTLQAALADGRIGAALRLMHDDPAAPWTVARLAAAAGMSRSAFAGRFAALVGRPPLDHLRHRRLAAARQELARPGAAVAEVADRAGYRSLSAFGHAYKRAFGATPGRDARPRP